MQYGYDYGVQWAPLATKDDEGSRVQDHHPWEYPPRQCLHKNGKGVGAQTEVTVLRLQHVRHIWRGAYMCIDICNDMCGSMRVGTCAGPAAKCTSSDDARFKSMMRTDAEIYGERCIGFSKHL